MSRHDQNFDEDGHPTAATSPPGDDEIDARLGWHEPPDRFDKQLHKIAPGDDTARGQAARAVLEIILGGRTASSVRIRAELLRREAEGGNHVETLGELATRLKVTRRALEKARADLF